LLRGLVTIILGDADRFEALRILVTAESCGESQEAITAVSTFRLDFFAYFAPGNNHEPRIMALIDVLV
jgi:hypothetical protein